MNARPLGDCDDKTMRTMHERRFQEKSSVRPKKRRKNERTLHGKTQPHKQNALQAVAICPEIADTIAITDTGSRPRALGSARLAPPVQLSPRRTCGARENEESEFGIRNSRRIRTAQHNAHCMTGVCARGAHAGVAGYNHVGSANEKSNQELRLAQKWDKYMRAVQCIRCFDGARNATITIPCRGHAPSARGAERSLPSTCGGGWRVLHVARGPPRVLVALVPVALVLVPRLCPVAAPLSALGSGPLLVQYRDILDQGKRGDSLQRRATLTTRATDDD